MPTIGVQDDTVTDVRLGDSYGLYVTPIDGTSNTGGTLDSIEIFMDYDSTGSFDDCTVGLYYGGAAALNDPDGATQIAEKNFLDLSTNYGLGADDAGSWIVLDFDGETIPADEDLYVVCLPHYYINQHLINPAGSSDVGDCSEGYLRFDSYAYNVSTTLPTTLDARADATATSTYPVKVLINYTEAAGGISGSLDQATETDTALASGSLKTKTASQATETDSVLAFGSAKVVAVDQAETTELAQALSQVTATLTISGITGGANLSNLEWVVFDSQDLGTATILAQGTGESTDGSGDLVVDLTGTGVSNGATVWYVIKDTSETNAAQGPGTVVVG